MKQFISLSVLNAVLSFILRTSLLGQPTPPSPIDLSGTWKLNTGETVVITQSGNNLTATFSPPVQCHDDVLTTLFISPMEFTSITGRDTIISLRSDQFWTCTHNQKLIDDCGLTPVYVTKFHADVSPDGSTISGEIFLEGWAYDTKDGKYVNCHLDSKYDEWKSFTLTRAGRKCDDLQRAYDQKKGLLDAHDAGMQAIAKQYNDPYDRLAGMQDKMKELRANAEAEWDEFALNKTNQAKLNFLTTPMPFPPAIINVPFTAVQSVIGYYQTYQAFQGTIEDMKDWARKQPLGTTEKMLQLLNYLDDMGGIAGQMSALKNQYDHMQEHREPLERAANDARKELDACLGNQ